MSPFLSVIVPTMRAGGLDVLFDSLAAQAFTDFELVLVDNLHAHRVELVKQAAWERFLKVVHVPPHTPHFPVAGFCCDANTGLMHASGEVAVFMTDFTRLPPDCLEKHARFHQTHGEHDGYMAPHRYIHLQVDGSFPKYGRQEIERYATDVRTGTLDRFMWSIGEPVDRPADRFEVDAGTIAEADADPKLRHAAGQISPMFFHGKNESVRLERALEVNGWDESLDGCHGWQDSDFSDRLSVKAGVHWTLDPTNVVEIANPRGVFPFASRVRDFRTNEGIWFENRARGYPTPNKWNLRERRGPKAPPGDRAWFLAGKWTEISP